MITLNTFKRTYILFLAILFTIFVYAATEITDIDSFFDTNVKKVVFPKVLQKNIIPANHIEDIEINCYPYQYCKINADKIINVLDTGSMEPIMFGGNKLLVKKYDNQKLKKGNIIIWGDYDGNITNGAVHTIIDFNLEGNQIITYGVNNKPDQIEYVDFESIKYIVIGVLYT